jgi:hypothetical protein
MIMPLKMQKSLGGFLDVCCSVTISAVVKIVADSVLEGSSAVEVTGSSDFVSLEYVTVVVISCSGVLFCLPSSLIVEISIILIALDTAFDTVVAMNPSDGSVVKAP